MSEKFEPIKVVKPKGKELVDLEVKFEGNLGQAAKDNFRLERVFEDQKALIEGHLKAFKKLAKAKYLDWQFDKVDAYNNALTSYANELNIILKAAVKDINQIRKEHPELFDELNGSPVKQLESVKVKFGPKLAARIINKVNKYDWFDNQYGKLGSLLVRETLSSSPVWWKNLNLTKDAREGIQFLRKNNHEIVWCTAPWTKNPTWEHQRRAWLDHHFQYKFHGDVFISTADKEFVDGDYFIDDLEKNVTSWKERHPQGTALLFYSELNLHLGNNTVNWKQIIRLPSLHK